MSKLLMIQARRYSMRCLKSDLRQGESSGITSGRQLQGFRSIYKGIDVQCLQSVEWFNISLDGFQRFSYIQERQAEERTDSEDTPRFFTNINYIGRIWR
ncbi:hypothetical protein BPAE_0260g00060 [Botrytis paeoniae]|uniref:Uncharacterized protein n=1 Tax=Botrytis paeoniae TaxID=278948 RepID=A0A4Z1FDV6_9HELO|nr:hypothetical protein BPAE_0260g00060 [Botrytis paeoniae]